MRALRFYLDTFGMYGIIVSVLSRLSRYISRSLIMFIPILISPAPMDGIVDIEDPLSPQPVAYSPSLKRHSVFIRLRTSDIDIFREIYVENGFDVELSRSPRIIVDAGAYTGLSSVYFAARYPNAKIIAIEPEKSNFDMLVRNIHPFSNIVPIQAALWKEVTTLGLYDPGQDHWAYQTIELESQGQIKQSVPSVTIEMIMHNHNIDFIDILKLDIEGAEKEVLEFSSDWVHKVGVLIVELHDRFKKGCRYSFETATNDFEYEETRGEKIIRMRKEFVPRSYFKT